MANLPDIGVVLDLVVYDRGDPRNSNYMPVVNFLERVPVPSGLQREILNRFANLWKDTTEFAELPCP